MVAAYHSLVGLAAAVTSIANVMIATSAASEHGGLDGVHATTAFLGDVIGAITLTGSVRRTLLGFVVLIPRCLIGVVGCIALLWPHVCAVCQQDTSATPQKHDPTQPTQRRQTQTPQAVAFGKLQGILDSKPLALPGKNAINWALFGGILAAAGVFATNQDPGMAVAALVATAGVGGVLGAHLTASIGAAGGWRRRRCFFWRPRRAFCVRSCLPRPACLSTLPT